MNTILKQLQCLKENELYSNICKVCEVGLLVQQKSDFVNLQITLYHAEALFHTHRYLQAENLYKQALILRKTYLMRTKNATNKVDSHLNILSDMDIKYQIYLCCMALNQKSAAEKILQTVAVKNRTPKIHMALGNLYKEMKLERPAISSFKEVLKECPLALEAIEGLLQLGVMGIEVSAMTNFATSEMDWFNLWVKAQAQFHSKDYVGAIKTYRSMDAPGLLKDNAMFWINIAYCHHLNCDTEKAIAAFQKAYTIDPLLPTGRDVYASILTALDPKDLAKTLENLSPRVEVKLWAAEEWIVVGNYMLAINEFDKALFMAQQGWFLDRRNIDAVLLKARVFSITRKFQDAVNQITDLLRVCNYRYDIHKVHVDIYLAHSKPREALTAAVEACKQLNYTAHSYYLHATALLADPLSTEKAVSRTLEKALELDEKGNTDALLLYADYLKKEKLFDRAVKIMLQYYERYRPSPKIHVVLAQCLAEIKREEEAFHHYNLALQIDPTYQQAIEGLEKMETYKVPVRPKKQYTYEPEQIVLDNDRDPNDNGRYEQPRHYNIQS